MLLLPPAVSLVPKQLLLVLSKDEETLVYRINYAIVDPLLTLH